MGKVVSVINWKGGVGKTTFSHHLATGLQELKKDEMHSLLESDEPFLGERGFPKVLLIDSDAQCNLSIACLTDTEFENMTFRSESPVSTVKDLFENLLVDEEAELDDLILKRRVRSTEGKIYLNVDLIPSHPDLIYTDMNFAVYSKPSFRKNLMGSDVYKFQVLDKWLAAVKGDYDFILIDCPPNLNFITQNALFSSDYYLIPAIPDKLSSYGILSITNKVKELNNAFKTAAEGYTETQLLGIVANNIVERSQQPKESQRNALTTLKSIFDTSVFENYLTLGDGISRASALGFPVYALEEKNANAEKQSKLLRAITREFLKRMK